VLAALAYREEAGPMPNIDKATRRVLVQNADLSREKIESSRKSRVNAIIDICYGCDIVWAVWSNGQTVIKGQELVATAALRTSWIAIPCADEAEAADLERKLA
jgi:hypothetical protein